MRGEERALPAETDAVARRLEHVGVEPGHALVWIAMIEPEPDQMRSHRRVEVAPACARQRGRTASMDTADRRLQDLELSRTRLAPDDGRANEVVEIAIHRPVDVRVDDVAWLVGPLPIPARHPRPPEVPGIRS